MLTHIVEVAETDYIAEVNRMLSTNEWVLLETVLCKDRVKFILARLKREGCPRTISR